MFAGGALSRMTIFALNIMPYISASIIMQLMTAVSPQLEQMKKEGETGRKKINQYTRYLTVLIASLQAYGHRRRSRGHDGGEHGRLPSWIPDCSSVATTVITLTGGTMFLMWLGEQITARGVGNGISLIIFAGIVAELPSASPGRLNWAAPALFRRLHLALFAAWRCGGDCFIVFIERAQRRIVVSIRSVSAATR